jgi:fatty-acyl-CoA synthase
MKGYWGDEGKTASAIRDGWMYTGDKAVFDHQGNCSIVGRIKDTIIRGGENIAPKEVEDLLLKHDDILEAQVFAVNDDRYGEVVAAWIRKRTQSALNESAVQAFCRDKVQKFVMREEMEKMDKELSA